VWNKEGFEDEEIFEEDIGPYTDKDTGNLVL